MRCAKYESETVRNTQEPTLARLAEVGQIHEPLLITMEDLSRVLRSGKTKCFELVGSGEIESVQVGRKRMPVWESVKGYVARLRAQAKIEDELTQTA